MEPNNPEGNRRHSTSVHSRVDGRKMWRKEARKDTGGPAGESLPAQSEAERLVEAELRAEAWPGGTVALAVA